MHQALAIRTRQASLLAVVATMLFGGCGASTPHASGSSARDKQMAERIAQYFKRMGSEARWYEHVETIQVARGVIRIRTDGDLRDKDLRSICGLIHGSDEADFTEGHTIGPDDRIAFHCRARPRA